MTCDGQITPAGSSAYGSLTIDGNLTLTSTGLVNYDLTGNAPLIQYDQLTVTGQATLAGTLGLNWRNSFIPAQADKFDLLSWGTRSGEFSVTTNMIPSPGHPLRSVYRPNRLVIGELAGLISPAVPVFSTPRNVAKSYDLTTHNKFAIQPSWTIDPADTPLYTASIASNLLTITPKPNASGTAAPTVTLTDLADGFSDVQPLALTIQLIEPTPPTPYVFPTGNPWETDDLVCGLLPGTVGPGCTLDYEYVWTNEPDPMCAPNCDGFVAKEIINGPKSDVVDILDASFTDPGEIWTCSVRTYDSQYYSNPGVAHSGLVQALTDTHLAFTATPTPLTLGQALTLSGNIAPTVGAVPILFDETVNPSGGTDSRPANLSTTAQSTYSFTFLPDEAGGWAFHAKWAGSATHNGDWANASVTVNKAQPTLSLALSRSAALRGLSDAPDFAITATLSVAGFPPQLASMLSGKTVRLSLQTPNGETPYAPLELQTDASGRAVFTKAIFDAAGIEFTQSGLWRFKAEFAGNENLVNCNTQDFDLTAARLTIKAGAGYAIVVLGQLDPVKEGRVEHKRTTDFVHRIMRERGLADEDIRYLRDQSGGELAPTRENLQAAIQTWARDKILASPAPLYIVMLDHGSPGKFHLDKDGTGAQEEITAIELNQSLSLLESALSGITDRPEIVVSYGACYSGSFIPVITAPGRIIVTSCQDNEVSYRGVDSDQTGVRDGEFFTTEFFRNLGEGRNIKDAFERACTKTYDYTSSKSNGGQSQTPQHPLLDDNGDGVGTTGSLPAMFGLDGARVAMLDLGLSANAGEGLTWFTAQPPVYIAAAGGTLSELRAEMTGRAFAMGDSAWLEIKTPEYDYGVVATTGYEAFQRVVEMAGPIAPGRIEATGPDKSEAVWTQTDLVAHPDFTPGFDTAGTYKVYYFLKDGLTGRVGSYLVTNVYVGREGNQSPGAPTPLAPANHADTDYTPFFAWSESTDPEHNAITYELEVSTDPAFPTDNTLRKTTHEVATRFDVGPPPAEDVLHYWRVTAVDAYGARSAASPAQDFLPHPFQPGIPGAVMGRVLDAASGLPVPDASVLTMPLSKSTTASMTGLYFIGQLPQGVYTVRVTANGYAAAMLGGVLVESNAYTTQDILLEPDSTNHAPTLMAMNPARIRTGAPYALQLQANDPDAGQTLTYTPDSLPTGAVLDAATGHLDWTPDVTQVGVHTITFTVKDNGSPQMSDTGSITITVVRGPRIEGPATVHEGMSATLEFKADDLANGWTIEWEKDGLQLTETTATLVIGKATQNDEGTYTVTAFSPAKGETLTASFHLDVLGADEATPLTLWPLLGAIPLAAAWRVRRRKASE